MKDCEVRVKPEKVVVIDPGSGRQALTYRCPTCKCQLMLYKGTFVHTHDLIRDDEILARA